MIQTIGWKNLTFHQTEIGRNICPFEFADDDRVTDRVQTVFVGPGVEGGEIKVIDLFPVYHHNFMVLVHPPKNASRGLSLETSLKESTC